MKTVKIRNRKGEFQVYEKDTNKIVFRAKTKVECFKFLTNQDNYSLEGSREKGIHYVY